MAIRYCARCEAEIVAAAGPTLHEQIAALIKATAVKDTRTSAWDIHELCDRVYQLLDLIAQTPRVKQDLYLLVMQWAFGDQALRAFQEHVAGVRTVLRGRKPVKRPEAPPHA